MMLHQVELNANILVEVCCNSQWAEDKVCQNFTPMSWDLFTDKLSQSKQTFLLLWASSRLLCEYFVTKLSEAWETTSYQISAKIMWINTSVICKLISSQHFNNRGMLAAAWHRPWLLALAPCLYNCTRMKQQRNKIMTSFVEMNHFKWKKKWCTLRFVLHEM